MSRCSGARLNVTVLMGLFIDEAESAVFCDRVLLAIGRGSDGGWMRRCDVIVGGAGDDDGSACILGGAFVVVALGRNDGDTLGGGSGFGVVSTLGDGTSGGCCRVEKIARRLSTASSWSSVLVGV